MSLHSGRSSPNDHAEGIKASPSITSLHAKRKNELKLEAINQQLADVRRKIADSHQSNHKHRKKEPTKTRKKSPKKTFHHPKLDFVMGEVVFSPYMTKPLDPYPHETFEIPKRLHELKKHVKDAGNVPKDELPYDIEFIRDRFINEVANFSVSFTMSAEERSPVMTARSGSRSGIRTPFSRQDSLDNSFCIDDSSLFAKSSITSAGSLPPVQTRRKVASSSGMRTNKLKSSSNDQANNKSQTPSTSSSTTSSKGSRLQSTNNKAGSQASRFANSAPTNVTSQILQLSSEEETEKSVKVNEVTLIQVAVDSEDKAYEDDFVPGQETVIAPPEANKQELPTKASSPTDDSEDKAYEDDILQDQETIIAPPEANKQELPTKASNPTDDSEDKAYEDDFVPGQETVIAPPEANKQELPTKASNPTDDSENKAYEDDFVQDQETIIAPPEANKQELPTKVSGQSNNLNQSDLELLLSSFAMMSHMMGR